MRISIDGKRNVMTFVGVALLLAEYFSNYIHVMSYTDEIVAVFLSLYLLVSLLKKKRLSKNMMVSFSIIIFILMTGLFSNIMSGVQVSKIAILLDIISNFKLLLVFFSVYECVEREEAEACLNFFVPVAKVFLICGMIFGIASLFFDLGMGSEVRYGIASFRFIYSMPHIYAMEVLIAVLIVMQPGIKGKNQYFIMAVIQMVLTVKGTSLVWVVGVLLIVYYMRYHKKLHISMLIVVALLSVVIGQYQISNYLKSETAPRYILIMNGIKTATNYFPIGSGFATYGSNMSYEHYSPLYDLYGMSSIYGFTKGKIFGAATDCYWPMLMGQGGFISAFLMLFVYLRIFSLIQKNIDDRFEKAILISVFGYFMLHSIGAATPTMSSSVTMFIFIALHLKKNASVASMNGKENDYGIKKTEWDSNCHV